jgi:hypothetical protein
LSLEEENPSKVKPATADPEPSDNSSKTDNFQRETPNPLQRLSRAVTQILSPKSSKTNTQEDIPQQNPTQTTPQHSKSSPSDNPSQPARFPTLAQPPTNATFFDNDEEYEDQQDDEIPQIPLQSPAELTSSTRSDLTYPPNLTKPKMPTFSNYPIQRTLSPDDNNIMRSWTTCKLFATVLHGHANSLNFGQDKSLTLIPSLALLCTTSSSLVSVIPVKNTLLMAHQMLEAQSLPYADTALR